MRRRPNSPPSESVAQGTLLLSLLLCAIVWALGRGADISSVLRSLAAAARLSYWAGGSGRLAGWFACPLCRCLPHAAFVAFPLAFPLCLPSCLPPCFPSFLSAPLGRPSAFVAPRCPVSPRAVPRRPSRPSASLGVPRRPSSSWAVVGSRSPRSPFPRPCPFSGNPHFLTT